MKVSVSILDCDFARLGEEVRQVEEAGADYLHLDVMDGRFVDSISFGLPVAKSAARVTRLPVHTHLMVEEPVKQVPDYTPFSAMVEFHVEATSRPDKTIQGIKEAGVSCGVSLNPETPVQLLRPWLEELENVLLMSVHPGKGGQEFMPESLTRIRELRALIRETGSGATISVDGGVNPGNCTRIAEAGADVVIAGSSVFGSDDYAATIRALRGRS